MNQHVLTLEGKEAIVYYKWLITVNKLFRQGQCTYFTMVGTRYFSMSKPTIYPDSKFLSEIELNISQYIGAHNNKELNDYADLYQKYPQLIHFNTRILFDNEQLFEFIKLVKPTKLKDIMFYGDNNIINNFIMTDIEDHKFLTSNISDNILTTNIPRYVYTNSNTEFKLKNSYGESFDLVGTGVVDHRFFDLIFNNNIPLDMILDNESITLYRNSHSIEYKWQTNGSFNSKKIIFISKQMIPEIMNDSQDGYTNISVFVENSSQKYYILRITSLIPSMGILISSDAKIIMI